jgi:hypothetical protein
MNCKKIQKKLSSYIDKEIDEKTAIMIEKHLTDCIDCKNEYELLLKVKESLRCLSAVELPTNFYENIYREVCNRTEVVSVNRLILNWFIAKKKLALGFSLVVILFFSICLIRILQLSQGKSIPAHNLFSEHLVSVNKEALSLNNKSITFVSNNLILTNNNE